MPTTLDHPELHAMKHRLAGDAMQMQIADHTRHLNYLRDAVELMADLHRHLRVAHNDNTFTERYAAFIQEFRP